VKTFYVTFGVQYPREPHPLYERATGAGWVRIEAASWERARDVAFGLFGPHWSFLYTELEFDPSWHEAGQLAWVSEADVS